MNINGYLNSEDINDVDTREDFIDFVGEIEAIPKRKVLDLERYVEYWNRIRDEFFER